METPPLVQMSIGAININITRMLRLEKPSSFVAKRTHFNTEHTSEARLSRIETILLTSSVLAPRMRSASEMIG